MNPIELLLTITHALLPIILATLPFHLLWLIPLKNHLKEHRRRKQLIQHLLHDLQTIAHESRNKCTCQELRDLINTLTTLADNKEYERVTRQQFILKESLKSVTGTHTD